MGRRFSRRTTTALIIYYAMITAICAPLAFQIGKAHGRVIPGPVSGPAQAGLSRNGTPGAAFGHEAPLSLALAPFENPAATGAIARARTAADRGRNAGSDPLTSAVVRAIARAGGQSAGQSAGQSPDGFSPAGAGAGGGSENAFGGPGDGAGDPLSLALAPGLTGVSGGGAPGSGGGGIGGASGGADNFLIPDIAGAAPESPPLVTPVPPAAPLLAAGLVGFAAAARRRA